jgi:hypothetical protein
MVYFLSGAGKLLKPWSSGLWHRVVMLSGYQCFGVITQKNAKWLIISFRISSFTTRIFLFSAASRPTVASDRASYTIRTFRGSKTVETWSWPVTSIQCRDKECVDLYVHSPICISGAVFNEAQQHLHLLLHFTNVTCVILHVSVGLKSVVDPNNIPGQLKFVSSSYLKKHKLTNLKPVMFSLLLWSIRPESYQYPGIYVF